MILGKLGYMVDVVCPSAERVDRAHLSSVFTSMGGRTSRQVASWRSPRVWTLSWGARDLADVGPVQALVDAYGPGPFQFRPVHAANLNLLTPEVAVLDPRATEIQSGAVSVGPVVASDGLVLHRQVVRPTAGSIFLGTRVGANRILTPLRAGRRVSASVYGRGASARLQLIFTDAAGAWVGTPPLSASGLGSDGQWNRLTVSATPPVGAVACRLVVLTCTGAAHAAITETTEVQPWAPGEGVAQVSISQAASTDLLAAWGGRNLGSMSVTITEDMV